MRLFKLARFETYCYQTHTIFIATSLEQAKHLCNEFYDKYYDKAQEYKKALKERERLYKEERIAKQKAYDIFRDNNTGRYVHKSDWEKEFWTGKVTEQYSTDHLNTLIWELEGQGLHEYVFDIFDFYGWWDDVKKEERTLSKKELIKSWMKDLQDFESDSLLFHSQVDGD